MDKKDQVDYEKMSNEVFEEINKIRQDPKSYLPDLK